MIEPYTYESSIIQINNYPATDPDKIKLIPHYESSPQKAFDMISLIRIKNLPCGSYEKAESLIKKKAAKLGADAVYYLRYRTYTASANVSGPIGTEITNLIFSGSGWENAARDLDYCQEMSVEGWAIKFLNTSQEKDGHGKK